jgi:hypothetical protein
MYFKQCFTSGKKTIPQNQYMKTLRDFLLISNTISTTWIERVLEFSTYPAVPEAYIR